MILFSLTTSPLQLTHAVEPQQSVVSPMMETLTGSVPYESLSRHCGPGVNPSGFKDAFPTCCEGKAPGSLSGEMTPMESLGSLLRLAGTGLCKERVW